jgi:uncharacterized protein
MSRSVDFALKETQAWVRHAVVGLNLCPFAKAPMVKGQISYVVSDATSPQTLLDELCAQMHLLARTDPQQIETTLLIHPNVLGDFAQFNDFLDLAEGALEELGYSGVLQLASFHPLYQFAGSMPHDISNATNRSPYPTLHLLREESLDRAVQAIPNAESIYETNIRALQALGVQGWAALQERCRRDARA